MKLRVDGVRRLVQDSPAVERAGHIDGLSPELSAEIVGFMADAGWADMAYYFLDTEDRQCSVCLRTNPTILLEQHSGVSVCSRCAVVVRPRPLSKAGAFLLGKPQANTTPQKLKRS